MPSTRTRLREAPQEGLGRLSLEGEKTVQSLQALLRPQQGHDLRWHHRLGKEVARFRGTQPRFQYGQGQIASLARKLGCSATLLTKSLAFAEQWPAEADVDRLTQLGVQWSHLVASLTISDRQQRLELLQEAAKNNWTVARMRLEVRQRLGGPQHPSTGRPPRPPHGGAPEVELEDLISKSNQWDRFLVSTWLGEKGVLARMEQADGADANLLQLLNQASEALRKVAGRMQQVRRRLKTIRAKGSKA